MTKKERTPLPADALSPDAPRTDETQAREGTLVLLALSHREIADLVGTTAETAIPVMSRWRKEGLLNTDKTGFWIRDVPALRGIALTA